VGDLLAAQIAQIWNAATFTNDVQIAAIESTFTQPVHKIDDRETDKAKSGNASLSQMERVFAKERLLLLDYPDAIEMPMLAWRVGNWAMATFTGQMFAQCALDLRYASPFETTALVELANGWGGYVGRRMDYILGGYEMQLARSSFAMPGTGEEILGESVKMLKKIYVGE
jgi:hypothetical protein